MSKTNIVMITSCKGGVGKTTVCANLAMTLAKLGKKVLMLDCDFGMRCLDLICGLEDKCMYDLCDVIVRHISYDKAVVRDERSENLYFLAAPYRYENDIDEAAFEKFIDSISTALELDYIFIDTHGGNGPEIKLGAAVSDMALIVATHQSASLRAAEQTNQRLCDLGVKKTKLIINCFDQQRVKKGELPGIIDIIDKTFVKLIGVIPTDHTFVLAQRKGKLVDSFGITNSVRAFFNIALRIEGNSIPLMNDFKKIDRKIILK
ncbi:MAG: AAA family ATPase [Clostridia bacterium]|nr:AAA family ATPase [Clostridia bacterium]